MFEISIQKKIYNIKKLSYVSAHCYCQGVVTKMESVFIPQAWLAMLMWRNQSDVFPGLPADTSALRTFWKKTFSQGIITSGEWIIRKSTPKMVFNKERNKVEGSMDRTWQILLLLYLHQHKSYQQHYKLFKQHMSMNVILK